MESIGSNTPPECYETLGTILEKTITTPTSFFSLPRELRDQIYALALPRPHAIPIGLTANQEHHNDLPITASRQARFKNLLPPPLAHVSRQLRLEALPIYYQCNTFIASLVRPTKYAFPTGYEIGFLPGDGLEVLRKWLKYLEKIGMPGKVGKLVLCRYKNEEGEKAYTRAELGVKLPGKVEERHVDAETRDEEVYGAMSW